MEDIKDYKLEVYQSIHKMLNALHQFNLPIDIMQRIQTNIKKAQYHIMGFDEEYTKLRLVTESGTFIEEKQMRNNFQNYILECPPIFSNNSVIPLVPNIYMMQYKNKEVFLSMVYHELCHLFAVGNWNIQECKNNEPQDKTFMVQHYSGISSITYQISEKRTENVEENEYYYINECLNDMIASILYEEIEHKPYIYQNKDMVSWQKKLLICQSTEAIVPYFSNDQNKLKNMILSGVKNKNLEDLEYQIQTSQEQER